MKGVVGEANDAHWLPIGSAFDLQHVQQQPVTVAVVSHVPGCCSAAAGWLVRCRWGPTLALPPAPLHTVRNNYELGS